MRLKIIAGNVLWVVVTGLIAFFVVRGSIVDQAGSDVADETQRNFEVLQRSFRLAAGEFTELVRGRASTPEVAGVFNASGTESLRTRAHTVANGVAGWLADPARGMGGRPEIVLITDETGRVLARDLDPERMFDTQLSQTLPVMRDVLEGRAMHTLWRQRSDNKILRTVAAPVRSADGRVIGAIVVGYDLSNGFAEAQAGVLTHGSVGYVIEGECYSASGELTTIESALGAEGPFKSAVTAALESGQTSSRVEIAVGDDAFLAVAGPLPGISSIPSAMVSIVNASARLERAAAANIILLLTAVAALGVFIYSFLIGTSLLQPLETIEEGVLKVINGRTDFRIDIDDGEFGGLAYRINQLINMLTGVEESDEEGHTTSSGTWGAQTEGVVAAGAPQPSVAGESADGSDANLAAQLAAEPAAQYYQRVYNEYIAAKQAAGEDVSNIAADRFIERLKGQEANMAQKKGCRMVRFQVQSADGQVSLKPVLIN
ncbi:MAG: MXAN_5187 C-terminal domain-containing protein [Polyangiales bacterium]|nr:hypothetical protein [Myxococcales bacterium]MCB9661031.1 hypothetical protein [Sandaracinaceae bacterium]